VCHGRECCSGGPYDATLRTGHIPGANTRQDHMERLRKGLCLLAAARPPHGKIGREVSPAVLSLISLELTQRHLRIPPHRRAGADQVCRSPCTVDDRLTEASIWSTRNAPGGKQPVSRCRGDPIRRPDPRPLCGGVFSSAFIFTRKRILPFSIARSLRGSPAIGVAENGSQLGLVSDLGRFQAIKVQATGKLIVARGSPRHQTFWAMSPTVHEACAPLERAHIEIHSCADTARALC